MPWYCQAAHHQQKNKFVLHNYFKKYLSEDWYSSGNSTSVKALCSSLSISKTPTKSPTTFTRVKTLDFSN
jgi:hypothetical protein